MEHGTWNMEHGTWNMEHGTWNIPEHPGTSNNYDNFEKKNVQTYILGLLA